MANRRLLLLSTILFAVILLFAVGAVLSQGPATVPARAAAASPAEPTTPAGPEAAEAISAISPYRIAMDGTPDSINIWGSRDRDNTPYNRYVLDNLVHSLYGPARQNHDFVPILANGLPPFPVQVGNQWVLTIRLKSGIRWSDGVPLTADDVAFTYNTCRTLGLGGLWADYCPAGLLNQVVAVNAGNVSFFFSQQPSVSAVFMKVLQAPILPRHFWNTIVAQATLQRDPINWLYNIRPQGEPVLGPFRIGSYLPGAYIELEANPLYYFFGLEVSHYPNGSYYERLPGIYSLVLYAPRIGFPNLIYTVGPFVSAVRYDAYANQAAAVQALVAGKADTILSPTLLPNTTCQSLGQSGNFGVLFNQTESMHYMAFNMRRSPMNLLPFRRAVATLVDRDFPGTNVRDTTNVLYDFVPASYGFWYTPTTPIGQGMSRQARITTTVSLLTSAGFTWTVQPSWDTRNQVVLPGSGLHLNGQPVAPITLLAPTNNPVRITMALSISTWLKEAGIAVTPVLTDFDSLTAQVFNQANFDLYILGWGLSEHPYFPTYLEEFFHSRHDTLGTGDFNTPGYNSRTFDLLADNFLATGSISQARSDALAMQNNLAAGLPYVTLFNNTRCEPFDYNRVFYPFGTVLEGLHGTRGMPELVKAPAVLSHVSPDKGPNNQPVQMDIFGENFGPGAFLGLQGKQQSFIPLEGTQLVDSTHLRAVVPISTTPGVYTVSLLIADSWSYLPNAYEVVDYRTLEDLYADPLDLWTDPASIRAGQPITPRVGLILRRLGGLLPLQNVRVSFFQGNPAFTSAKSLGTSIVPLLFPNGKFSTIPVNWIPPGPGNYDLYAVIDPLNAVSEINEGNNVVSRTVRVLPPRADTTPPVMNSLIVSGNMQFTGQTDVILFADAQDDPGGSGVDNILLIEFEFIQSVNHWVPIAVSGWLPYGGPSVGLPYRLTPSPGVHYVLGWAADRAGNISPVPKRTFVNYLPVQAHISQGQVHIYRHLLTVGDAYTLTLTISNTVGQVDLYVWDPADKLVDVRDQGGTVQQIMFTAASNGQYQYEVEGMAAADYRLQIVGAGGPVTQAAVRPQAPQAPIGRFTPFISGGDTPDEEVGVPDAPIDEKLLYLPSVHRIN